jgi:chemotaxis protein methyltransferase CheR
MTNRNVDRITIPDHLLARLSEYVSEHIGLYFPLKRRDVLHDKILLVSKEYGFNDAESCIHWLLSSPLTQEQIETLSSFLTIGETHFYRDKRIYDELENHILPELINIRNKTGKHLKIWSAGCSSGEEPYSIAILLHKMIPDITEWNISILATDINPGVLRKAAEGIYKKWSFRDTPEWVTEGYFLKARDGCYTIKPVVKNMVSFSYHNLAKDPFPSLVNNTTAIDMIFCRNVIMYFRSQLAKRIINRFYRSLLNGGLLVVSGSEGYLVHRSRFVTVTLPDAIFFRKDLSKPGEPEKYPEEAIEPVYQDNPSDDSGIFPEITVTFPDHPFSVSTIETAGNEPENLKTTETTEKNSEPLREATVLYDQGNYPEAEDILTKYLSDDQQNHEAISLLAKACSNQGKFGKAIELCRKEIETDKCNQASHYLLALIYQEQGNIEKAISSLYNSIYLDPNHVLSHYTLGIIFYRQGKFNKAKNYFNNALSILDMLDKEEILPESDGISAGRLSAVIRFKTGMQKATDK